MTPVLSVRSLTKTFALHAGLFSRRDERVPALWGVDLDLRPGETYGLVGESGSGKTTLARTLVQLERQDSGTITYQRSDGSPWVVNPDERVELAAYRREVRYVFQDPASSLDPRMRVGDLLTVGTLKSLSREDRLAGQARARELLESVGLRSADWDRRPSEFSGGQRQRIALARALVTRPRLLLCDEVVSALDVSVRGQILTLLLDLKRKYHLALLFVAHDLDVVTYMSDRVGVFYAGRLMEEAPSVELTARPLHPYTQLLFASAPGSRGLETPSASPIRSAEGCPFAPRCPRATDICRSAVPPLRPLGNGETKVACHHVRPHETVSIDL